eukprot:s951_g13.t1
MLEYVVSLTAAEASLKMTLRVKNTGDAPFTFQTLLHTYFRIPDIEQVTVRGLGGRTYLDKVKGGKEAQLGSDVELPAFTDRVYIGGKDVDVTIVHKNGAAPCAICNEGFIAGVAKPIEIVVWNPYAEKSPGVTAGLAVRAGAKFIVTLGLNMEVVDWCLDHAIPVIPGVASPSEVELASRRGLTLLKFFPAEANGGPAGLKAISAPYPHLTFYPTGGVTEKNLQDYLALKQVVAVGGSWIVPQDVVASGNFELLKTLAHSTLQVVRGTVGLASSGKVATASIDHTARLWNIGTGECLMSFLGHEDQVMCVAFSPDGELLATASTDKTAKLWHCESGQCMATCVGHSGPVYSAFFSPDGYNLLTASHDRSVKIWDSTTGGCEKTLAKFDRTIHSAVYSPDGEMIATATDDSEVIIWNAATLQQVQKISSHEKKVFSVQFSHDSTLLLTASMDGSARISDLQTGKDKIVITGHTDWLRCAAFSPDSLKVVTASGDGKAKTWSAVSGKPLLTLSGHQDWLRMAAFSIDGGLIVTASKDGTAKVWRADNGECIRTLDGHRAWVRWAAFFPGRNIIRPGLAGKTFGGIWWTLKVVAADAADSFEAEDC